MYSMVSSLFTIFCKAAVSFAAMGGPEGVTIGKEDAGVALTTGATLIAALAAFALTTGATIEFAGECTGV